jgi:hypothetical protein
MYPQHKKERKKEEKKKETNKLVTREPPRKYKIFHQKACKPGENAMTK